MEMETAGDPMSGLKWTRKTTERIAAELERLDIRVSARTVATLLQDLGYSLRVNQKKIAWSRNQKPAQRRQRNRQFRHIAAQRHHFQRQGLPVISVDTKKKENIGNFKNPGAVWGAHERQVYDHDFPSWASGKGIPYGIYDPSANRGTVCVGTSHDTASFAVHAIQSWWKTEGRQRYSRAKQLLILADNGGSNRPTSSMWIWQLSQILCQKQGLAVTICHYPPGASKWNPIEHRLFSQISKNWAGVPLNSYEVMLKYIRTTKTTSGLKVRAALLSKVFPKKEQPPKDFLSMINLQRHPQLPAWNYTITPSRM